MNDSIQDRIGQSGIGEGVVPRLYRKLAGDDRGLFVVAIVGDVEQIAFDRVGQMGGAQIVDIEHVGLGQLLEERRAALQGMGFGELLGERGQLEAPGAVSQRTRRMHQRRGDIALADAGRAGEQDIESFGDPAHLADRGEHPRIDLARELGCTYCLT